MTAMLGAPARPVLERRSTTMRRAWPEPPAHPERLSGLLGSSLPSCCSSCQARPTQRGQSGSNAGAESGSTSRHCNDWQPAAGEGYNYSGATHTHGCTSGEGSEKECCGYRVELSELGFGGRLRAAGLAQPAEPHHLSVRGGTPGKHCWLG